MFRKIFNFITSLFTTKKIKSKKKKKKIDDYNYTIY